MLLYVYLCFKCSEGVIPDKLLIIRVISFKEWGTIMFSIIESHPHLSKMEAFPGIHSTIFRLVLQK